jgi:hypothetical protein
MGRDVRMLVYEIDKIIVKSTNEVVEFDHCFLTVDEENGIKSWGVDIQGNNDDHFFQSAMTNSEQFELTFITRENVKLEGQALVTKYNFGELGSKVELTGNGKLNGHE